MTVIYRYLLKRSGLTQNEAAQLHHVPVEQIAHWIKPASKAPASAIGVLYLACRKAEDAKRAAGNAPNC